MESHRWLFSRARQVTLNDDGSHLFPQALYGNGGMVDSLWEILQLTGDLMVI